MADISPPIFENCPYNVTEVDEGKGLNAANVSWPELIVTDNVDPSVLYTCNRESGSTFKIGTKKVTCTSTDSVGNKGTCEFKVEVKGKIKDKR